MSDFYEISDLYRDLYCDSWLTFNCDFVILSFSSRGSLKSCTASVKSFKISNLSWSWNLKSWICNKFQFHAQLWTLCHATFYGFWVQILCNPSSDTLDHVIKYALESMIFASEILPKTFDILKNWNFVQNFNATDHSLIHSDIMFFIKQFDVQLPVLISYNFYPSPTVQDQVASNYSTTYPSITSMYRHYFIIYFIIYFISKTSLKVWK